METLVTALGPVFVAAFAVQQLLELAFGFGLRVMAPFGVTTMGWLDGLVTAIVLSAGTEGSNSIMKVLQYYKESLKNEETGAEGKKKKKKA